MIGWICLMGAGGLDPASSAAGVAEVPRWQPHDFAFRSAAKHENPFAVSFSATVEGPGGVRFTTPGFHDGDGTWKVRVTPNAEGAWSLVTRSEDAELDGRRVTFTCVPNRDPKVHGGLQVDPEHPYHFRYEDGTRYYLMGYECDWLWALDFGDPTLPTVNAFLDRVAAVGFNHVLLNAYAHDTRWREGKTGADDYGPPPRYAWGGTNDTPDHGRFNLAYWQHYDRVIEALSRRGMVAHVMIRVYNKAVNWPARGGVEDDRYFRWLIARYAAYPNVVWDFSKEAHNERDLEYKQGRLRLLRQEDPYRRLITNHDDDAAFEDGAYDTLVDFRSDQHHREWHATILRQRQRHRWPAVNVEFGYEHGPGGLEDKTYGRAQSPEEVCRRAWEIAMAGGYGAYYYTYTAWDVIRPEHVPPGYAYFRRLREFFEGTRYWLLEPADELVSEGYCLAEAGKEYVVFLNEARPFTLKLEGLGGPLAAEWYRSLTGERVRAGSLSNGSHAMAPPAAWADRPVALHVGSAAGE
jgi:hypothetical protein